MKNDKDNAINKYADIINLPHHVSKTRPKMDVLDRAAQFSPFAALTGYDAAIEETERITEKFIELDEDRKLVLNEKLQFIVEHIEEQRLITIVYFQPDLIKEGGTYADVTGVIKKVDEFAQCIVMKDNLKIPVKYVYDIVLG